MLTLTIDPSAPAWHAFVSSAMQGSGVREAGGRLLPTRGEDTRQATARLSLQYAAASWNRLRTALRREDGLEGVSFYVGKELHKTGMAHLHVLVRRPGTSPWLMPYPRLWKLASSAGFGRIQVDVAVSKGDVARYVSKSAGMLPRAMTTGDGYSGQAGSVVAAYGSKSAEVMPKWTRRGSWSRDWCEWSAPTPVAGFAWRLGGASADFIADGFRSDGWQVVDPARLRVPGQRASGEGG